MSRRNSTLSDTVEDLRKMIPGFDWLKLDRIDEMCLSFSEDKAETRLTIAVRHPVPGPSEISIVLQFDDVREFQLPTWMDGNLSFGEFVVEDVSARQLEGIKYHIKDYLTGLAFYCQGIQARSSWNEATASNED